MSNLFDVTVVIPCYNSQGVISRAVSSVIEQTSPPARIIIVDDFSTDCTFEELEKIRERYRNTEILLVRNSYNLGPGMSRNLGWEMTSTPLIAFLDADDAWHPRKLEIQIQILQDQPHLSMVCSQSIEAKNAEGFRSLSNFPLITELTFRRMLFRNLVSTRSVLIRREVEHRFPKGLSEDYYLWLKMLDSGMKLARVEFPLTIHFRPEFSPGGLSGNLLKHEIYELRRLAQYFKLHPTTVLAAMIFSVMKFARRLLIQIARNY